MIDLFCRMFLVALFVFYAGMVLALLGQAVQIALRPRPTRSPTTKTAKAVRRLTFSPQAHRR